MVWPRRGSRLEDESVPTGRQFYRQEVREEIRRRHAAGESLPELSRLTGIPYATLKAFCGHAGESVATFAR